MGYTRNERLERRTAAVYGDDIGLSASRATPCHGSCRGRHGPGRRPDRSSRVAVTCTRTDVVNAGFVQGETSHVAVLVVYDELAVLDEYEGVDITRLTRELEPQNPLGLNLMRITVDGKPIDDPKRSSADIQRCTDVALPTSISSLAIDNLRSCAAPQRLPRSRRRTTVVREIQPPRSYFSGELSSRRTLTEATRRVFPHVHELFLVHRARRGARVFEAGPVASSRSRWP